MQLVVDVMDLLLPVLIRLPLLPLQVVYLHLQLADRLGGYDGLGLPRLLLLFILGQLLLHLFDLGLLHDVLLMVLPQNALILHQLLVQQF